MGGVGRDEVLRGRGSFIYLTSRSLELRLFGLCTGVPWGSLTQLCCCQESSMACGHRRRCCRLRSLRSLQQVTALSSPYCRFLDGLKALSEILGLPSVCMTQLRCPLVITQRGRVARLQTLPKRCPSPGQNDMTCPAMALYHLSPCFPHTEE